MSPTNAPNIFNLKTKVIYWCKHYNIKIRPERVIRNFKPEYQSLVRIYKGVYYLTTDLIEAYPPLLILEKLIYYRPKVISPKKIIAMPKSPNSITTCKQTCTIEGYSSYWGMNEDMFREYLLKSPFCKDFWIGETLLIEITTNPFHIFCLVPKEYAQEEDRHLELAACFNTEGEPNIVLCSSAEGNPDKWISVEYIWERFKDTVFRFIRNPSDSKNVLYSWLRIGYNLWGYSPRWFLDDKYINSEGYLYSIRLCYPKVVLDLLEKESKNTNQRAYYRRKVGRPVISRRDAVKTQAAKKKAKEKANNATKK